MALQLATYTDTIHGHDFLNIYIRVLSFDGDKDSVRFTVGLFVDEQARLNGKQPIEMSYYEVPYIDGMAMTTLYDYLKTLPEYTSAVNV